MRCLTIPVLLAAVFMMGCASQERRSGPAAVSVSTGTVAQQAVQAPKPAETLAASPAAVTEPPITENIPTPQPISVRTHKVWIFESLWSISKKYYGDGSLWPLIYEANKDQIVNPGKIYPKQELVIPQNGN